MAGINDSISYFESTANEQGINPVFSELASINESGNNIFPALLINAQGISKNPSQEYNVSNLPRTNTYQTRFFFFDIFKENEKRTKPLRQKYGELEAVAEKYFAEILKDVKNSNDNINSFSYQNVDGFMAYNQHSGDLIQISFDVNWDAPSNCEIFCDTQAPTNLMGTTISDSQINLSWDDNSGGTATFELERTTLLNTSYTKIADISAGTTTYNDTGLDPLTVYFYRIRALNGCYSEYSNVEFLSTQSSSGVCADATAILKDTALTTLSTTIIASGASANITAPDASLSNSDASYTASVKSNEIFSLPDINITKPNGTIISFPSLKNIDIRTYASGIVYNRPLITGQLTSYATYDAGWHLTQGTYNYTPPPYPTTYQQLDKGAVSPFVTLLYNNAFGNKNRFTYIDGTQTYTTPVVIDHLTGLMWTQYNQGSGDWASTLINVSTSLFGYTGWRLPQMTEYDAIRDCELQYNLNYAPFNSTSSTSFWSANTRFAGGGTVAHTSGFINYSTGAILKTNGTPLRMYCRNYY